MNFKELSDRALAIREKYAELESKKYGKEWTASQIMTGFVGDVGDLAKLTMAKDGVRDIDEVDEKIAHELADCLWSILILANKYGVDLEKSFLNTMDMLEKKIANGSN